MYFQCIFYCQSKRRVRRPCFRSSGFLVKNLFAIAKRSNCQQLTIIYRDLLITYIYIYIYTHYKIPPEIIRATKLVASLLVVANRGTRSDSHSIDRSLHSVCRRSFRGRCNWRIHKRIYLIGSSCSSILGYE